MTNRRGTQCPPVPQIWCNSDYYLQSYGILKKLARANFCPIQAFFMELRHKLQPLCQGKGQRSHRAKNRRKHFLRKIGQAISNMVAVLVSDLWAMAGKNGTVFDNNWPPFWMCHSDRTGARLTKVCWLLTIPLIYLAVNGEWNRY